MAAVIDSCGRRAGPGPRRRLLLCLLTALAVALSAAPGAGQQAEDPAATPAEPAPEPATIPAEEVAEDAQKTQSLLAKLRERAQPSELVGQIEDQLPEIESEIREALPGSTQRLEADAAPSAVEKIQGEWVHRREIFSVWRKTLSKRGEALAGDLELLGREHDRWQETKRAAQAEGLPVAVIKRIRETLAAILEVKGVVKGRRSAVLTLQDKVAQQEQVVSDLLGRVAVRSEELRQALLALDSPPLWKSIRDVSALADPLARIRANWSEDLAVSRSFFERRSQAFVVTLIGFAALLTLILVLREPARRWAEEDEAFGPTARMLGRPIAAAIMVALLAFPMFMPPLPAFLASLLGLVVVVTACRFLAPILQPEMTRVLYALLIWYVVDWARAGVLVHPLSSRLVLLLEAGTVAGLLLWRLRPARLTRIEGSLRLLRAVGVGTRVALVANAGSVLANVVGNVSLAELLTTGTLVSALLVYAFYAVVRVVDGVYASLLRTPPAQSLRMVRNHRPLLRQRGGRLINLIATVIWGLVVLETFRIQEQVLGGLWRFINAPVAVGDLAVSLGDLLAFGLMIWASFGISRFVRFVLEEDVLPRASLPRGVPFAISVMVRYVILLLGFVLAIAAAGIDMSRMALILGALGVGIGIGLQDVVNNFVSGLILLFERPIQQGDTVEVAGVRGDVRRIGIRSSTLRTWEGAEVVVPNSRFVNQEFTNWTLSDRHRRVDLPVGVAYGTDPEKVLSILLGVAEADDDVLESPEPTAVFVGFGDSSLNFNLRSWIGRYENWVQVQSNLGVSVNRALADAGITIPFPQRDLHVRSIDPDLQGRLSPPKE